MITPRRYRRRITIVASILACLVFYRFFSSDFLSSNSGKKPVLKHVKHKHLPNGQNPICPPLPGIEDILVVMKTGVTEAKDKVPIHFQTSFRCIPNYVIFSDYEEVVGGVRIYDALRNMDPEVKQTVSDFDIYNRIQKLGRAGLETDDFADEANSNLGKPNNPGWKLDKWKFLPMVQETLRYKSDAKWYVFMEADTYYSWQNLLEWLSRFDPSEPHYIGTETQIADVIFAHGGSGFVVSNPAMKRVADEYATKHVELNQYTNGHWAGDCVLGKVLADVGVPLHYSWPMLQNTNVGEVDEFTTDFYRKPWCFPAVAFHHLSASDIKDLWDFEQQRWQESDKTLLLHSDVFNELIYPSLSPRRPDWDNLCNQEHPTITTLDACKALCTDSPDCAQYSFKPDNANANPNSNPNARGKCLTSNSPKLGVRSPGTISGWYMQRIEDMMGEAGICKKPDFGE